MTTREVLKMYSDYKSPYAWLAFDPAFALEQKFAVQLKWMPFQLRINGEQFWGNDRIPMLERRLEQAGLSLSRAKQSA
jgi:2-hydroxychromene-2-carboxylate isomerase